ESQVRIGQVEKIRWTFDIEFPVLAPNLDLVDESPHVHGEDYTDVASRADVDELGLTARCTGRRPHHGAGHGLWSLPVPAVHRRVKVHLVRQVDARARIVQKAYVHLVDGLHGSQVERDDPELIAQMTLPRHMAESARTFHSIRKLAAAIGIRLVRRQTDPVRQTFDQIHALYGRRLFRCNSHVQSKSQDEHNARYKPTAFVSAPHALALPPSCPSFPP